jgi:cyclopropane fatty-acyl-phospholipid synthase-like methyltransferase
LHCCTENELALKKRFEVAYARSTASVMQDIERRVCGCDYGGNSWTTQKHADELISLLQLDETSHLLDLGAGSGWPGVYIAKECGCSVTLADLPEVGLKIAAQRAEEEGLAGKIMTRVADAADLPFEPGSFDAISHSDLLCCLVRKRATLQQCHQVIRPGGRMAFTVISLVPGLNAGDHARALDNAPDFVEAESSYQTLLAETGWDMMKWVDLTDDYRDSCARQIDADIASQTELADFLGLNEAEQRLARWRSKLSTIEDGLFLRELFVCRPLDQGPRQPE